MTWDRAFSMVFHTMQTQDSLSIGTTAFQLISMYREIGHWSFKGDIYLKSPCQNPTGSFLGQISKSNPIQASQHENPQPSTSLGISKPWLKRCCVFISQGKLSHSVNDLQKLVWILYVSPGKAAALRVEVFPISIQKPLWARSSEKCKHGSIRCFSLAIPPASCPTEAECKLKNELNNNHKN